MNDSQKFIFKQKLKLNSDDFSKQNGHEPAIVWFTGLSGSGKSTLANYVMAKLFEANCHVFLLDGDNLRSGLNSDLGFSEEDRSENIRRASEVAKLFFQAGHIIITAFISPFENDRSMARDIIQHDNFVEVFVDCPLKVCESRDPKSLYKKARSGEIKNFTGIHMPYERPKNPEVTIHTDESNIEECGNQVLNYLIQKQIVKKEF